MPMASNGLTKLMEECSEVIQVAAKMQACPGSDEHWDGQGSLKKRLEDEIADARAASLFVSETHGLDEARMQARTAKKLALLRAWHAQANDAPIPCAKQTP